MADTMQPDSVAEEDLAAAALTAHNNGGDLPTHTHTGSVVDEEEDEDEDVDVDHEAFAPFSLRRGHTHKRAEDPPKNEQGKMMCKFQTTCSGVTFDRKCEWR
jgi:hypothetical protein